MRHTAEKDMVKLVKKVVKIPGKIPRINKLLPTTSSIFKVNFIPEHGGIGRFGDPLNASLTPPIFLELNCWNQSNYPLRV